MIGNARRPPDRAEEDCLVAMDELEPVLGHHAPVLGVIVAAPRKLVPLERDAEFVAGGLESSKPFGNDLLADAVTRDDGDAMRFRHPSTPLFVNAHSVTYASSPQPD